MKRRQFIKTSTISTLGIAVAGSAIACQTYQKDSENSAVPITSKPNYPVVVATWNYPNAIAKAWEVLSEGKTALDAVEEGCKVEEANIKNQSVGKGGRPDRDGQVTLDASIMDKDGNCGAVVYLKNMTHAISVARKVMEDTPHVMLAGDGAEAFAKSLGLNAENLLTEDSKTQWENWKKESKYEPIINIENHDTIGMLAIDKNGDISGACSTSGLAYKMRGRVGDSPIIGSGLFIDNEVGGCTATGMGEEVVKTVGSFLVVELMRQGKSPQEACEEAVNRIVKKPNSNYKNFQVGYVALNKQGEMGSYAIHQGFTVSKFQNHKSENLPSKFYHNS